jgi:large subunit ribosomal protein L13
MGKHKPMYTPHMDTGDFVVVTNAEKVHLTGRKMDQKVYHHYTGWAGGLRETEIRDLMEKKPEQVIRLAVRRMLPKTNLGRLMLRKLKVYAGPEHPHAAQQPKPLDIEKFRG